MDVLIGNSKLTSNIVFIPAEVLSLGFGPKAAVAVHNELPNDLERKSIERHALGDM